MKDLKIEGTKQTFSITCDANKGKIIIEGNSYPENVFDFFEPFFGWLDRYIENIKNELEVVFRVFYINSSSSKCILDILDTLEKYHQENHKTCVKWYFDENDCDIKETGQEFKEDLDLPFKIIKSNS